MPPKSTSTTKKQKLAKGNNIAGVIMEVYNVVLEIPDHKTQIQNSINQHVEALLYNVASIASISALIDEKERIEVKHIQFIKDYISKQCLKKKKKAVTRGGEGSVQNGGSFPAEYFGYDSGAYAESNYDSVNYNDSVWSGPDASIRQAMPISVGGGGGSGGGSASAGLKHMKHILGDNKTAIKYMKRVMEFNGVTISKPAMAELVKLVNIHLNCVGEDISQINNIKPAFLEKMFSKRKYAVFN